MIELNYKQYKEQPYRKRWVIIGLTSLMAFISWQTKEHWLPADQGVPIELGAPEENVFGFATDSNIGPAINTDITATDQSVPVAIPPIESDNFAHEDVTNAHASNTRSLTPVDELHHYASTLQTLQILTSSSTASELISYLQQFGPETDKEGYSPAVFRAVYERLGELNFEETLDELLIRIDDPQNQNVYWDHLALTILASQQPEYVANSIALVSSVFKSEGSKQALNELSIEVNPGAVARQALDQLELSNGNNNNYDLLEKAMKSWILKDPELALAFAQNEITDESDRSETTNLMLIHWMDNAPAQARATIEAILNVELSREPDVFIELADVYLAKRSETDPAGAMGWLQTQESIYVREAMIDSVLRPWLDQDRDSVFNHFTQLDERSATELLPMALPTLVNSLDGSSNALQDALTWSSQLPAGLVTQTQESLINEWITSNPQDGADWLLQQSQGGSLQGLVLPAARVLAQSDSSAAARVYENLPLDMQIQLTDSLISSLSRHGEEHARQWLNRQTHPEIVERGQLVIQQLFQKS